MLHLGRIELTNNLLVIYLKGTRLLEALNAIASMKTIMDRPRISLKKYLLFLRKFIEGEQIPSHRDILFMDYVNQNKFFETYEVSPESAEELRFILMKIAEVYEIVYNRPLDGTDVKLLAVEHTSNNISMGLAEIRSPDVGIVRAVEILITVIKEVETAIVNVGSNMRASNVSVEGIDVLNRLPLEIDKEKVLTIISKIMKLSRKI